MEKEKNQYEGFLINVVVYFVAMLIGSCGAVIGRTLLSMFIHTPNMTELKADGTFLFDTVYPMAAIFTILGFLSAGFFCCYLISRKIAYKTNKLTDRFKVKTQLAVSSTMIAIVNVYVGFTQGFTGIFGMQFWYPAAWISSVFKVIDKTNLLEYLTTSDISYSNFVLDSMKYRFNGATLMFAAVISVAYSIVCYYGRKLGTQKGIEEKSEYLKSLRGSRP